MTTIWFMSDPYGSVPDPTHQATGATSSSAKPTISVADLVAAAGALITLIFSFLAFLEAGDESFSAWNTDFKGFSAAIPALLALALLVVVGLGFANVALPDRVLTFTPDQIKATWGIAAAGIVISFIAAGPDGVDKGIGFWFMLIGTLAMAAGTVMKLLGKGTSTVAVPTASAPSSSTDPYQSGAPGTPPPGGSTTTPPPPPSAGAPPPPPPGF